MSREQQERERQKALLLRLIQQQRLEDQAQQKRFLSFAFLLFAAHGLSSSSNARSLASS